MVVMVSRMAMMAVASDDGSHGAVAVMVITVRFWWRVVAEKRSSSSTGGGGSDTVITEHGPVCRHQKPTAQQGKQASPGRWTNATPTGGKDRNHAPPEMEWPVGRKPRRMGTAICPTSYSCSQPGPSKTS